LKNVHYIEDILSETKVQINPHLFLVYHLFLTQRLDSIRTDKKNYVDVEYRQKGTFQIIPQLTMKRHCDIW
jgi:hypothetical protein